MNTHVQQGFTLLEIAVVVLIVGFLLAGVLKGQELVTSARVKRVAGQLDEIRAAYLGFEDRYKALPGDYLDADRTIDCGGSPCLHGNGDSRIRSDEMPVNGSQVHEDLLVWTHLAYSGFLKGKYSMVDGETLPNDANSPKNPYQIYLQIVFDGRYGLSDSGVPHHNLKTGSQMPVGVMMELDRKVDDGKPYKGSFLFSSYQGNGATSPTEAGPTGCTSGANMDAEWNLPSGNTNCGAAALF
jgi:prepilin-type N-terminal cleavage/methylation domain-containing protein